MEAYAKLVDRNSLENDAELEKKEFLITELPCSVGRVHIQSNDFFCIVIDSTDVLLSRQHAQIRWSLEDGWTLLCLSKNGLFVDERKYRKDEQALLRDGSDIRLGNAKLIFVLPQVETEHGSSVIGTTKKRSRSELLTETDDDGEDADVDVGNASMLSNVSNEVPPAQGSSTQGKLSYKDMIDAAFDSYELDLDEDQSVLQTELVDWIANKYYNLQDDCETRKQSLRKGLYSILMKHYERVGSDESKKRQKRGTIRWRPKQGGNFE